jgi:hypothetical protein
MKSRSPMLRRLPLPAEWTRRRWHNRVREPGRIAISPATDRRPERRPLTVTTGVWPRRPPVRPCHTPSTRDGRTLIVGRLDTAVTAAVFVAVFVGDRWVIAVEAVSTFLGVSLPRRSRRALSVRGSARVSRLVVVDVAPRRALLGVGMMPTAPPLPTDGQPEPSEPPTRPRWPADHTSARLWITPDVLR